MDLIEKDSRQSHHDWLQRFNDLTGDIVGDHLDRVFNSESQSLLKSRADITNPPYPGNTPGMKRYITSIQVNTSTVETYVQITARDARQDQGDDLLYSSVSFNCSVLRRLIYKLGKVGRSQFHMVFD